MNVPFSFTVKMLSVVRNQHLLLCTLLICNDAAMEVHQKPMLGFVIWLIGIFFWENVILKLGRWLWLLIKLLVVLWLGFSSNYIWEIDYLLSIFILGFCHEIAYEVDVWCALRCLLPSFLFLWMGELNWLFDDEYSCC